MSDLPTPNPKLSGIADFLRLLRVIADPDGNKVIAAEIEAATAVSTEAYGKLLVAHQEHSEREQKLGVREAALTKRERAAEKAAGALTTAQGQLAHDRELLGHAQAVLAEANAALQTRVEAVAASEQSVVGREKEIEQKMSGIETLREDALAALERARGTEAAAAAETTRLRGLRDRLSEAARSVAEAG